MLSRFIEKILSRLVEFSIQQKYLVFCTALTISALSTWVTIQHARIDTNTENMLSEKLDWRVAYDNYKADFPFFSDSILVVVEGPTPDLTYEAASHFVKKIIEFGIEKETIFFPESEYFFEKQKFLYLEPESLKNLSDTLGQSQAMLGMLAQNPSFIGLLNLTDVIFSEANTQNSTHLAPFITSLTTTIDSFLNSINTPMSWRGLLQPEINPSPRNRLLFAVQPELNFGELLPGSSLITHIRKMAASISTEKWPHVKVRLTGPAVLGYDELDSVVRGARKAGFLALIAILIVLSIGLKSMVAVFSILTVVIIGLTYTSAFAILVIGSLNMISIAFSVLYVGLAADFAIHYYLSYIEERTSSDHSQAIVKATHHNIIPLSLCALTTSVGFLAFIPTVYKGVAELGLIAGAGMVIGLLTSLTVLPALISIFHRQIPCLQKARSSGKQKNTTFPTPTPTISMFALALIFFGGVFTAMQASFDANPLHLNDPNAESVVTLNELSSDGIIIIDSINFVADSREEASNYVTTLLEINEVNAVKTIESFIPNNQEEKIALIDRMMWSLGGEIEIKTPSGGSSLLEFTIRKNLASLENINNPKTETILFKSTLNALLKINMSLDGDQKEVFYNQLDSQIMRHFPSLIAQINSGLEADKINIHSLPESLRKRWVSSTGRYRIEILPNEPLNTNAKAEKFIKKVREAVGRTATGVPIINLEASRAVINSFVQAFLFAIAVVACVIWFSMRSISQLVVVITPLIIGCVFTIACITLLNIPINFANIIALPLLIGISVDSTLHVLYRYKRSQQVDEPFFQTSTAKAVLLSALTTGASFGNLAFSPHAGTASMGVLLTVGLTVNLICSLVVLPILLRHFIKLENIEYAK